MNMVNWKAGLVVVVCCVALPLTMAADCGGSTEKHKIRKQPVYTCAKSACKSKGRKKPKPGVTISCKKRLNGTLNCKK